MNGAFVGRITTALSAYHVELLSPAAQAQWHVLQIAWYEQFWLPLHVPVWDVYQSAVLDAAQNMASCVRAVSILLFLTFRPIVTAIVLVLKFAVVWIYKYVLVDLLSVRGTQHLLFALRSFYDFQKSLTVKQWLMEVGVVVGAWTLYELRKWLQRQRLVLRLHAAVQRRVRRVRSMYRQVKQRMRKGYRDAVSRIASVSLWLAVMMPHALFWGTVVAIKLVIWPRFWAFWAAETSIIAVLNWWYPILATIWLVFEVSTDLEAPSTKIPSTGSNGGKTPTESSSLVSPYPRATARNATTSNASAASTPSTTVFSRTHPIVSNNVGDTKPRRRRSSFMPSSLVMSSSSADDDDKTKSADDEKASLQDRVQYWFQYWIVHCAIQVAFKSLRNLPILGSLLFRRIPVMQTLLLEIELTLYLWIYVMPYLIPDLSAVVTTSVKAPQAKPLDLLSPLVLNATVTTYQSADITTDAWWKAWPVRWMALFCQVGTLVGLLKQPTADALCSMVEHGQSLLLPALTLFVPIISIYGLLFVQYCAPMAKQVDRARAGATNDHLRIGSNPAVLALEFWVLHALLTAFLERIDATFWWVPGTRFMLFSAYWWLSCTSDHMISATYRMLQDDLQAIGLLPHNDHLRDGDAHVKEVHKTRIGRLVHWILDHLPRAIDPEEELVGVAIGNGSVTQTPSGLSSNVGGANTPEPTTTTIASVHADLAASPSNAAATNARNPLTQIDGSHSNAPTPSIEDHSSENSLHSSDNDDDHPQGQGTDESWAGDLLPTLTSPKKHEPFPESPLAFPKTRVKDAACDKSSEQQRTFRRSSRQRSRPNRLI